MDKKTRDKDIQDDSLADLRKAAEPLIKYLCENHHLHVTAIVTPTSVELFESVLYTKVFDFLKD